MPYKNREKQLKYMRDYMARRKKKVAEQNDLFMRSFRLALELLDYPDVFNEAAQNTVIKLLEAQDLKEACDVMTGLLQRCEKLEGMEKQEKQERETDMVNRDEFQHEAMLAGRVLPKMKVARATVTVGSRGRGK